jgi:maltose alpha-D-glucosyltransferase/alpha-amylase
MKNVMKFWLDMGIDGFRADAVPYLIEREGTNCENLLETHQILKDFRSFLDQNYEGKVLLAEANQWPEDVRPYFGNGDEFHMGFHFPLMPRIYMALRKGDASSIHWIMARTPDIPKNTQWCTFLRNHDELTLEMVTEEERQWMWAEYAPDPRMRLNLGIRRRLTPLLDNDHRKILLANAIIYALPGAPIIYYGDEIGMGDNIWLFDRNGVRTPMQWHDGINSGFSSADPDKLFAPVIDTGAFTYKNVNVAAESEDPGSLLNKMRNLVNLRKANPIFALGEYEFLAKDQPNCLAILRTSQDENVLCVFNLTEKDIELTFNLSEFDGKELQGLNENEIGLVKIEKMTKLNLKPYAFVWFHVID